ncbi:kinesin-like protein KIF3C isoform X1 [Colossoma macropomum]|uniref:kinesin-like protein KIF3C isoform X1 n=1 Tax=Colossoma macropomum TaxID=42526 RepID=UPI0018647014|nr:kinesin-like protein KIF3C isoform X1 [Colossoma macropomum]
MSVKAKQGEAVKVVVRCRPLSRREEACGYDSIVSVDVKLGLVALRNPGRATPDEPLKTFTFDAAYDGTSRQGDVYDEAVRPLVDSVLQGFNGTVFAYGQTGTGKTYTMQGQWMEAERRGIIPRSFEHIFTHISRSQNQQYLVRASYLEIYQEEIRDLLAESKEQGRKLELKESPESGVYVRDLSSFVTKNVKEIEHVMNAGNRARSVGFTNMNEHSSRSHAIFTITVECGQPGPDGRSHIRVGKLNLVDLAGSERQAKTGVRGERLKEAAKINLSLSALGNVISALVDGRSSHVPYRDSKLTRLLRDSLGGNAKTIMVATLGPASCCYEETLTTLRYASRAKNIKNVPRVNEDPKDALLREFQQEIARLKAQLDRRGMLTERKRKRRLRQLKKSEEGDEVENDEEDEDDDNDDEDAEDAEDDDEESMEKEAQEYMKEQQQKLEREKEAIMDDCSLVTEEKQKLLEEKERMMGDLKKEQEATALLTAKFKAMESKLLVGGKNIIDHTNEQQKMLEQKRQEIADQTRKEREMQQQMLVQDEETLELRETFSSLQQEVEAKTKKLKKYKKLYAKLQAVKAEIQDVNDEHIRTRQELEQTQNELTRELKFKYLIIENFIPPEEKNKIMNRLVFDAEEDQWKFQPLVPAENKFTQMKKRPASAVGYKRPISQFARVAIAMGAHSRYRAENIMILELDMTPPTLFQMDFPKANSEAEPSRDVLLDNASYREKTAANRVRKSRSWCQAPRPISTSSSALSLASSGSNSLPHPHSAATATAQQ